MTFFSSSIRCPWVCSRPAVSAISTSMSRARAACKRRRSRRRDRRRRPARRPARRCARPRSRAARRAAARKVSPAASMTLAALVGSRCASLPIVVVLPAPLMPTTRITNGLDARGSMISGRSTGARISTHRRRSAASSASRSPSSLRATRLRRSLEDPLGRRHADVGGEQARLELVEDLGVDLAAGQQLGEVAGQERAAAAEARPQPPEEAAHAGGGRGGLALRRRGAAGRRLLQELEHVGTRAGRHSTGVPSAQKKRAGQEPGPSQIGRTDQGWMTMALPAPTVTAWPCATANATASVCISSNAARFVGPVFAVPSGSISDACWP